MCGIVGYVGEKQATPILMDGLKSLEYRGYDSAGVAVYDNGLNLVKTKGRLVELEKRLEEFPVTGIVGIGHTRWATHGEPSEINSHPHMNEESSMAVVHNGIIENYMEIRDDLLAKGHVFVSETDTEVAVHLIEHYYNQNQDLLDAVILAIKELKGSYALGVIHEDYPNQLIAARKDSPLVLGLGEGENFIASDIPAILKYTRNVYLLDDEEVAVLTKDSITIYDLYRDVVTKDIFKVTWDVAAAEKDGYEHFMMKEIMEQPKVIKDMLASRIYDDVDEVRLDNVDLSKEKLSQYSKIYIVACGTAYYSGLVGKSLIERLARIPVITEVASEFRYSDPIIDKNTLMIVISQSGETADTLAALRLAQAAGTHVIGVVNAVGSTIAREADDVLYTLAGPEIAVASTKAYSAQVCAMYLIATKIAMAYDKISIEEFRIIRNELFMLPSKIKSILDKKDQLKALAEKYADSKNVFYIGRGLDFAVSMEGALKIKEIAYLHAEPYAAGELKHGPIALIEKSTLLVGLLAQEEFYDKTISNIKEVKARGAKVLAIAMEGKNSVEKVADDVFYIPRTHWMIAPLLANIPQQLFAYYIACALGRDVDKPRNLAKSVTVE
ncbi:MAG: glutamine--fructose-6-phosphate transaminase (isomerizing) [Vallitaleaceae bacterium]|jgi:glucosamine--fructose-6-phosphate aminotransferase (isomerizing)|nr:glutamine--fructose-6-phosphate transaminase (isomerizing) [Vallitaleaceae bacterium]